MSAEYCVPFWRVMCIASLQGNFRLDVEQGEFTDSEIIVMLGENGTGKTTFIRMIAKLPGAQPDDAGDQNDIPEFNVSYKPQKISPKFPGTVSPPYLLHGFWSLTFLGMAHQEIPEGAQPSGLQPGYCSLLGWNLICKRRHSRCRLP